MRRKDWVLRAQVVAYRLPVPTNLPDVVAADLVLAEICRRGRMFEEVKQAAPDSSQLHDLLGGQSANQGKGSRTEARKRLALKIRMRERHLGGRHARNC